MAEKVLIYAGTTEGRLLAQELSRAHIACDVHVATEYGQMVMPELAGVKVLFHLKKRYRLKLFIH